MKAVKNVGFMDRVAEWNSKWMGLMLNLQAGLQIITGLRQGLQSLVADFAQMEEARAQVRKYTGMTHEEVKGLNDELRKIDTRTSRERLNELAGDAGKLGITAKDIDVAEVHDVYTVSGIMALQDLGFFKKGEAGKAVLEGRCQLGGDAVTVNTSGGLKARGHPIGATGVAQIVEVVEQLRGSADKRQVENAKYGLAQSSGGTGSTVAVSILEAI